MGYKRCISWVRWMAVFVIALHTGLAAADQSTIQDPDYYRGKTLKIIVPFGPGGGYDKWARLVAPGLKKRLQLSSVEVINKPGGGGTIATNALYNSSPDGLTIGEIPGPGALFSQIQRTPGIRFDIKNFEWIGCASSDPAVLAVREDSDFGDISDILQTKKPIVVLAVGVGATYYNVGKMLFNALGVPFRIVAAFKGSHPLMAAFVSGQGDVLPMSYTAIERMGPKARVLLQLRDTPAEGIDAPTISDLGDIADLSDSKLDLLRSVANLMILQDAFVSPPGTPKSRLALLQKTFRDVVQTEDFRRKALHANLRPGYTAPHVLAASTAVGLQHSKEFAQILSSKTR